MLQRLLPCLLLIPAIAQGQSSVWKISKGEQTLYIGGTCHILRLDDYPLPSEFDLAYAAADKLVLEIDPADLQNPAFQTNLMQACMYTDGRSLKTVLSKEAYDALAEQAKKSNLPIEMLNGFKPGMAVMMLGMQEMAKLGVHQAGVDMHYAQKATKDGKPVDSLETARFQIKMLSEMGEGNESEFVLYGLKDMEQIGAQIADLIHSWRTGNLSELETRFIDDMKEFPTIYQNLLVKRNRTWMPKLEAMLATVETEFVLVGVGHAAGSDGLLTQLKSKGYTVEQVIAP